MYSIGLRICSFFIKPRYSKGDNRIPLNKEITYNINKGTTGKVADIFAILSDFVSRYTFFGDDELHMKMFSFIQNETKISETEHYRTLSTVIKSGPYGYESELTDKNSGEVKYHRTAQDADIKRFSCLFFVPKDQDELVVRKGIIVFQEIGAYGVKTITTDKIITYFSSRYELKFETRSISPVTFVKQVLKQGEVQKITFIKNSISNDDSDNLVKNAGREEVSYILPEIRQPVVDRFFKPRLLAGDGVIEIEEEVLNVESLGAYSDIKFNVNYGNRQNTISLIDMSQFSIVEEVPGDLILHSGQPKREELRIYMINIARKYRDYMLFQ